MKKRKLGSLLATVALGAATLGWGALASATPTPSYGALPGAGTYYGSGNFDANWTIASDNGIVLGLNFKDRQSFALLDGSSGTYFSVPGTYPGGGGRQHTSYQFSVDYTNATATGLTFQLCVDHDPSLATALSCVNPATYWGDNYAAPGAFLGFQNSQNIGFGDTPGGAFDPGMNGTFDFVLTAFNGAAMLDTVTARVQIGDALAVPEPGTLALLGLGAGALAWSLRRRKPG